MRNCLPHEIVARKKYGFPTPENLWLEKGLKSFVKDTLYSGGSFSRETYNRRELDRLVKLSDMKNEMARSKVWLLCVFEIWNKVFIHDKSHSG